MAVRLPLMISVEESIAKQSRVEEVGDYSVEDRARLQAKVRRPTPSALVEKAFNSMGAEAIRLGAAAGFQSTDEEAETGDGGLRSEDEDSEDDTPRQAPTPKRGRALEELDDDADLRPPPAKTPAQRPSVPPNLSGLVFGT